MQITQIVKCLTDNGFTCKAVGQCDREILGFSSIYNYKPDTITWLRKVATLEAEDFVRPEAVSCLITGMDTPDIALALCQIKVEDPRAAFFFVVDAFWAEQTNTGISDKALIEEGASIGVGTQIGAFSVISSQAVIGKDCVIGNNVSIRGKVHIGDRCVIQSGAVIGEDGFAHTTAENGDLVFVKHYGGVWIGDDVSIGSGTCVCRGTIDDTVLMNMCKIDNLCHIAHNVVLEERVRVIAGAVIMGSVRVGRDSWIATSMIRDQRRVGQKSVVGMGAVVVKDVPDGVTVAGNPAKVFERKEKI